MKIFIDSSFLVATVDPEDTHHQKALKIIKNYNGSTLFFDELVKYESINVLLRNRTIKHAKILSQKLSSDIYSQITTTDYIWQSAFANILIKYSKSGPNVFDYIHFACMQEYGLTNVLTFDHHLSTAGFNVLT